MKKVECGNKTAVGRTRPVRTIRHLAFVIFLGVVCLLFATKSFGQSSNRWLLVFNTSSAMRDRVDGIEGVTQDLLTTAMHGNLRSGDSIGIWTYDSRLRAEEAPLLTWNPDAAPGITQHALGFLGHHHYETTAAFGNVLTNMLRVIKLSDVITVILVSDGEEPINGTPFDARINAFYKTNYRAQRKAHMPVVTVFRGEHGVITTNTVSLSPFPVDIPPVPPPPIAKAAPAPPPPVTLAPEPKPVIRYGEPLIIIGKKPEPAPTPPAESTNPAIMEPKSGSAEPPAAPKVVEKNNSTASAISSAAEPTTGAPTTNTSAENETWAKPTAPPAQPGVETAASVPPQSLFSARNIAIVSAAFAVLVCGFLILAARRARSQSQSSLITRSLDREGK